VPQKSHRRSLPAAGAAGAAGGGPAASGARPGSSAFSALRCGWQLLAHCRTVVPWPPPLLSTATEVHSEVDRDRSRCPAAQRLDQASAAAVGQACCGVCFHQPPQRCCANSLGRPAAPEERWAVALGRPGLICSCVPRDLAPERWVALAASWLMDGAWPISSLTAGARTTGGCCSWLRDHQFQVEITRERSHTTRTKQRPWARVVMDPS